MPDIEAISVLARVRPFNRTCEAERAEEDRQAQTGKLLLAAVDGLGDTVSVLKTQGGSRTAFRFTAVLDSDKSNAEITGPIVDAVVERVLDGKNAAVLAYGSTGSGKTYTMFNTPALTSDPSQVGLSYALVLRLLQSSSDDVKVDIKCSVLEVYNEHLRCLLTGRPLSILVDNVVYQDDKMPIQSKKVETPKDFISLIASSEEIRQTGKTNMNEHSSRSHLILRIDVDIIKEEEHHYCPHILLVDLAGSETADGVDGGEEGFIQRGEEGRHINQSLLALSRLIRRAAETKNNENQRDYLRADARASKLTRLVRSCIAGDAYTSFIMCLSPLARAQSSTMKTLLLAHTLCGIKNTVKPQLIPTIDQLKAENVKLRRMIKEFYRNDNSNNSARTESGETFISMESEQEERNLELLNTIKELKKQNTELQDELDVSRQIGEDVASLKEVANTAIKKVLEGIKTIDELRISIEKRTHDNANCDFDSLSVCGENVMASDYCNLSQNDNSLPIKTTTTTTFDDKKEKSFLLPQFVTDSEDALKGFDEAIRSFSDTVNGLVIKLNSYEAISKKGDGLTYFKDDKAFKDLESVEEEHKKQIQLLSPILSIVENVVPSDDVKKVRDTLEEVRDLIDKTNDMFMINKHKAFSLATEICSINNKLNTELEATKQQLSDTLLSLDKAHERIEKYEKDLSSSRRELQCLKEANLDLSTRLSKSEGEKNSLTERLNNNSEIYSTLLRRHMELISSIKDANLRQKYLDAVKESKKCDTITLSLKLQRTDNALDVIKKKLARTTVRKERMEKYYRECLKNLVKLNDAVSNAFGVGKKLEFDLDDLYHNENIIKACNFTISHWNFLKKLKEASARTSNSIECVYVLGSSRNREMMDSVTSYLCSKHKEWTVKEFVTDNTDSFCEFRKYIEKESQQHPGSCRKVVLVDNLDNKATAIDDRMLELVSFNV